MEFCNPISCLFVCLFSVLVQNCGMLPALTAPFAVQKANLRQAAGTSRHRIDPQGAWGGGCRRWMAGILLCGFVPLPVDPSARLLCLGQASPPPRKWPIKKRGWLASLAPFPLTILLGNINTTNHDTCLAEGRALLAWT